MLGASAPFFNIEITPNWGLSETKLPTGLPHALGFPKLRVLGRRWRLLKSLPPTAAQTGRAVFPHPAFTKLRFSADSKKVLIESS